MEKYRFKAIKNVASHTLKIQIMWFIHHFCNMHALFFSLTTVVVVHTNNTVGRLISMHFLSYILVMTIKVWLLFSKYESFHHISLSLDASSKVCPSSTPETPSFPLRSIALMLHLDSYFMKTGFEFGCCCDIEALSSVNLIPVVIVLSGR